MRYSQSIRFSETNQIVTVTYYSLNHLKTADKFVRKAIEIEKKYNGEFDSELSSELHSYGSSTILNVVAFLEANINEILFNLIDDNSRLKTQIPKGNRIIFKNRLKTEIEDFFKYSILEKYEFIFKKLCNNKLSKGKRPYQDVKQIINLRNILIHYKPSWKEWINPEKSQDLFFKRLKNKFKENPFFRKDEPFFPERCLGSGCAKWALEYSLKFTDEFSNSIGTKPIYNHIREKLIF